MTNFTIEELTPFDLETLENFCLFAHQVRRAPYDVGLLPTWAAQRLVLWGLGQGAHFWMIRDQNSRMILRFSLMIHPLDPLKGLLGFFEIDLAHVDCKAAFHFSIEKAMEWFNSQGAQEVIAPVDLSTWFSYRFSVPGDHFFPRQKWEPTTPEEFLELFKLAGFSSYAFYHSVFFPLLKLGPIRFGIGPLKRSYERLIQRGFTLRDFDQKNFKQLEIPKLYEISQEAFSDSLLFSPIDLSTFSEIYAAGLAQYDFSPSKVLLSPEGEMAGFLFAFYDGDYFIIKSLALLKKFQGLGISSGLVYPGAKIAFDSKKKYAVSALVRNGLASEKMATNSQKLVFGSWYHHYLLVKKDIR